MDLVNSIMIAASGLRAQGGRMRVIAENIANSASTAAAPGADPYRRRIMTFENEFNRTLGAYVVKPGRFELDRAAFGRRYEPGHPAADKSGYIKTPNVNTLIEMMDMRQAQRSYEANLNMIRTSRAMAGRTLDILRS